MEFINFKVEQNIAWIYLNRPQVFNSFHRGMALELLDILRQVEQDTKIRCVVLSGEGKAFCAGQDLQEATDPMGPGLEKIITEHYNPIIRKIRELKKPVIAAINGVAAGAGANIALACDIVVATESASFIQAFSKIALIPDSGGTFFLPRLIGWQKASAMMMTGERIMAIDALQMGMIYKVFSDTLFPSEVEKLALQIALMPTQALVLTKKLLNESFSNTLEEQLNSELRTQIESGQTDDFKEGIQAFLEKRSPVFKGQ
ncbi:MAG: enoyl-CoA hydratase/isomerase family protein [Saprospiraceae bacterium]|nr:enoyl-CoA hydratase/isomerase family protein [Saprospiraceae bacterium]